jgi:hypothetical protein
MAYRERLLLQKNRWVTPFASVTRYESKIEESMAVPAKLGLSLTKQDLVWIQPALDSTFNDPDAGVLIDGPATATGDYSAADSIDNADILGEDEAALQAILSDDDSADEDSEDPFHGVFSWIVPVSLQFISSQFEYM